ncbi:MAG TPA: glycosyltransferase family 9 protein [Segetibacter sp.]
MGDIITCEPISRYLRSKNNSAYIIWVVSNSYKELVEKNPDISYVFGLDFFSEWVMLKAFIEKRLIRTKVYDLHLTNKRCPTYNMLLDKQGQNLDLDDIFKNNRNLTQLFSKNSNLPVLNDAPIFYLDAAKTIDLPPAPYIVFHTQTNADFKDWQPALWLRLYKNLAAKGFNVVEVGIKKQIVDASDNYIDFTGRQSLQSIGHLIANCKFFIGLDSGFAHMASALKINGLVLMGQFVPRGQLIFTKYNPFSGLYANPAFIVNTETGGTPTLEFEKVYERVEQALLNNNIVRPGVN